METCKDCEHYRSHDETQHCYMFKHIPEQFCMQHSCLKDVRQKYGPWITTLLTIQLRNNHE